MAERHLPVLSDDMPQTEAVSAGIYDYAGELKYFLGRIDGSKKIDRTTKEYVRRFLDHVAANGAGEGRQAKYARHLLGICERLGKPIEKANRSDMERLMISLKEGFVVNHRGPNEGKRQPYSPWTLSDYVMVTKRFMKFVRFGNTDRDTPFPEEVRWMKKRIKVSEMRRPEFLAPHEVEAMIKASDSDRDRAALAVQFEGGLRVGELLLMSVSDVSFDQIGARIRVRGKTGERLVRLISSVPLLTKYLETYKHRNEPESPLWMGQAKNRLHERLGISQWNDLLKKYAAKAGVNGKRIHSHLLRHGSATEAARFLSDSEMKVRFGWVGGSNMPAVYVHLSGADLDEKLQRINEGKALEPPKPEFGPILCPRCHEKNSPGQRFCGRCGCPLNPAELIKADAEIQELRQTVQELMKRLDSGK